MWSKDYRFFHEILKGSQGSDGSEFTMTPIEVSQSLFDSDEHHSYGSQIRINTLLTSLENAKSPYIIFSDADLIVKPGIHGIIMKYIDDGTDMVFLKGPDRINLGFMYLRVCDTVINFWKLVKSRMQESGTLDIKCVNELIGTYSGKYTTFDSKSCTLSNLWDGFTPFIVLHITCSYLGKEFNIAEKLFTYAQHINIDDYMQYVSEDIIPFIYKIQEILIRSHQQVKRSAPKL